MQSGVFVAHLMNIDFVSEVILDIKSKQFIFQGVTNEETSTEKTKDDKTEDKVSE